MGTLEQNQSTSNEASNLDYANLSYNEMASSVGAELENEGQASEQPAKNIEGLSPEEMLKMLSETKDKTEGDLEITEDDDKENIEVQPEEETDNEFFEILYKGQVEKVSKDEVVKLAQMGKDYTQKTQELANFKKSFENEKNETVKQLQNYAQSLEDKQAEIDVKFQGYERFDMALDVLKENDPEFYQEFSNRVNGIVRQYENPIVKKQLSKYEQEIQSLKSEHESNKLAQIRNQYDGEVRANSAYIEDLKNIGVFVDEKAVKEQWINGAKDVKTAINALYGDAIKKAYESKFKLNNVKKKTSVNVPTLKKNPSNSQPSSNISSMKYDEILNGLLSGKIKA